LKGKLEGKRPLGNLDVDGRIILKWILQKYKEVWTRYIWLRIETGNWLFVPTVMNLRFR
jgi:hypothetical protein